VKLSFNATTLWTAGFEIAWPIGASSQRVQNRRLI
jgi:hypothetical protein